MTRSPAPGSADDLDVAVIGMACRFPGASNIDEFWHNLSHGIESIYFFSEAELMSSRVSSARRSDPRYVNARGRLTNVEYFDAAFFDLTPGEAEVIDPQQRIFLECAWEGIEQAGYDAERFNGLIGVYAGAGVNTYLLNNLYPNREIIDSAGELNILLGNDKDFLSSRVSYKLNLEGPSLVIQTACSTSLVAAHLACQGLLNGDCDMALAGGISVSVPQQVGYLYQEGGILSPDGHCRAFDAKAQGTVGGSGAGVVVLKRLADALEDNDYIYAVVKGSAVNNDGSLKVGYTAPRVEGQARVIRAAQIVAGVEAESIGYVEAHGTGTPIGDPIEMAALIQAFQAGPHKKRFCAIGSVKTNLGHLDTAAGVAGLIKTALSLKYQKIPPSLHFEQPNPKIDFENSPFFVCNTPMDWPVTGSPRRAGVSSFGIGGTNAHVILEEAPAQEDSGGSRPWQLLVLSAKTASALEVATDNLVAYLKRHPDREIADVAYTLQLGRRRFAHRRILVCQPQDAETELAGRAANRVLTRYQEPLARRVVFMFSGQGSQYVNMGLGLYKSERIFRERVDLCSEILKPTLGFDLRDVIYPDPQQSESAQEQLTKTGVTQLALFAIEYATAGLWMQWGVRPWAMIGHSIGEYVAACLAGVLSLEDALSLIRARGRMMQQLPVGAMLSVPLPEDKLTPLLTESMSLAAVNGPTSCVVSGFAEELAAFAQTVDGGSVKCRFLHTSHAFHSKMMEQISEQFTDEVRRVKLHSPRTPYISNVTGAWITQKQATDPGYWADHMIKTVRFADGISMLLKEPNAILLEVGPGQTLRMLVASQADQSSGHLALPSLRHPQEQESDSAFLLKTLGRLWIAGVEIEWDAFYADERRRRVRLPTYPFERKRFWIDPPEHRYEVQAVDGSPERQKSGMDTSDEEATERIEYTRNRIGSLSAEQRDMLNQILQKRGLTV